IVHGERQNSLAAFHLRKNAHQFGRSPLPCFLNVSGAQRLSVVPTLLLEEEPQKPATTSYVRASVDRGPVLPKGHNLFVPFGSAGSIVGSCDVRTAANCPCNFLGGSPTRFPWHLAPFTPVRECSRAIAYPNSLIAGI